MNKVKIDSHTIGSGHPCFVIAEIGSNHDCNIEQAMKLIDVAAWAGADAVKFQSFRAHTLNAPNDSDYEILRTIELPYEWHGMLAKHCKERKIVFLSTPFDFDAVESLEQVGVPAYKIASGDITYFSLLEKVASTEKPVIISTGKTDMEDTKNAIAHLEKHGSKNIILLHCVAVYPTPPSELNLSVIKTMEETFNIPVGLSDHTLDPFVPALAVCHGAKVIEKHITTDNSLPGPDHSYALTADQFKLMVKYIRTAETAYGTGIKELSTSEKAIAFTGRRAIFAAETLQPGTVLSYQNIVCLRPQMTTENLPASVFDKIVGMRIKHEVKQYMPITVEDISLSE